MGIVGFLVVVVLWMAFAAMLVTSQPSIHDAWTNAGELPIAISVTAWVVLLPWMAAAAVWETTWPPAARAVVALGFAWATIYAFYPWKAR